MLGVIQVSFDLSLARGLDYYTGVIYEAILTGSDSGLWLCAIDAVHKVLFSAQVACTKFAIIMTCQC